MLCALGVRESLGTRQADRGQDREELLELYKLALEDYRFQVRLNWGRSQYFLVLNSPSLGSPPGSFALARDRTTCSSGACIFWAYSSAPFL